MKKLIVALVIILFCITAAWAEEGDRIVVLVAIATEPASKAQFYNPEDNTAPIKVTFTITEQGADFTWELLPQPTEELTTTIEPTITGE